MTDNALRVLLGEMAEQRWRWFCTDHGWRPDVLMITVDRIDISKTLWMDCWIQETLKKMGERECQP